MRIENGKIIFTNLDPRAPYSLGNAEYIAPAVCSCGGEEFKSESGYYDGYTYENVFCANCRKAVIGELFEPRKSPVCCDAGCADFDTHNTIIHGGRSTEFIQ